MRFTFLSLQLKNISPRTKFATWCNRLTVILKLDSKLVSQTLQGSRSDVVKLHIRLYKCICVESYLKMFFLCNFLQKIYDSVISQKARPPPGLQKFSLQIHLSELKKSFNISFSSDKSPYSIVIPKKCVFTYLSYFQYQVGMSDCDKLQFEILIKTNEKWYIIKKYINFV